MADSAIPRVAVDAHRAGMRTFATRGHEWRVWEIDGQLGFEVAGLPAVWIDAPGPLEQMSDQELIELVRSELDPISSIDQ